MIGNIIPPARAVLLGVAGAKIKSTPTSEYARPSVFFPNNLTNWKCDTTAESSFNESSRDKECHCNQPNTWITETLNSSLCIDNTN